MFTNMSGLGRYPLNIPSLSDAFLGSGQRRDRLDYDDRRFRERDRDRRDEDYGRRDRAAADRGRNSRDRFSPEPSYSSYLDDQRQGGQSDLISYPLAHLSTSRSDRGNDRNDRNRNQNNRDRYRNNNNNNNRSQGNRGPINQGPGIMGAMPGDRSVPDLPSNPLQVPALGNVTGSGLGSGLTAQLAQQQQQLMAMVQTQSLLAAMQAQANTNAQAHVQHRAKQGMFSPMGLLPTPLIPRNQSRDMQRQNRKRAPNTWVGGGNYGNKRERFDNNRRQQGGNRQQQGGNRLQQGGNRLQQNRNRQNQQSQQVKKVVTPDKETKKEEVKKELHEEEEEDETAQGDEEIEVLNLSQEESKQDKGDSVKTPVEFNDRPLPKAINFVGEDVDALMMTLFDKNRIKYICQQCKIICNIPMSFYKHLLGRRHARTVLEKQGKELDLDAFKKFTQESTSVKKKETGDNAAVTNADGKEKVRTSSSSADELDFVKYTCDTRKTAMKEGNIITISSVTQARVRIDGFTSGRNMLGCEFVKAVSGFNCRLCKTFIRCGNDVTNHIKGKKHQSNYKTYIQEHPQYVEHQLARNKELEVVLEPKEAEEVVLYEVLDKDIKSTAMKPQSHHKDSYTDEPEEVQITKFVISLQSSEEADEIHDEADLDVDMEGMDHVNEDSLITDESFDEQREAAMTTEDEETLYDPAECTGADEQESQLLTAECTGVDEPEESQVSTAAEPAESTGADESQDSQLSTAAQPEETEDFIPLSVVEPEKVETEESKVPLSTVPRLASNQWKEQENDSESSSQEDPDYTPVKEVIPTARRGRKATAKRGAGRGGAARGRGRGRGARQRVKTPGKAGKAKKRKVSEDAADNADVDLMEGFEVIDEIGDGED